MTDLAVVIPVYNEEEIIGTVINDWYNCLTSLNINFEIHLYNDGSKDNTQFEIRKAAENKPQVVLHNKENSGHGPTILKAYKENHSSNWLFQVDSDNEISSTYFPELWNEREKYDFLIGQRQYSNRPVARRIVSWFAKISVHLFYKKGITDVNIPYRLMRTSKFLHFFQTIPVTTFAPNVIITGIALKNKFRIKKINVEYKSRQTGKVSIKKFKLLKSSLKSLFQTIKFSLCSK
jgi:dolichol-phosphate mannosyltransferase